jgi:hypothetical protein
MASINASTSGAGGIITTADATGILNIQTAGTTAITVDASQNLAFAKGFTVGATAAPAFSAWSDTQSSALSSNVDTKVLFQVEEFDTNSNFASSRFTPTVAGYYQINAALQGAGSISTARIILFKNGAGFRYGSYLINQGNAAIPVLSTLVYANGTTDYFEIYGNLTGSGLTFYFGQGFTYFQAFLARSA